MMAIAATPCGNSSGAMFSARPLIASFTVCVSGFPPAERMSFSVTSTISPRRARIISGAACFAVMMCERMHWRKIASPFSRSVFQKDPHWRDHVLFYEYFHGDNGAGIGASHQTGWTGLVAKLIQQSGE